MFNKCPTDKSVEEVLNLSEKNKFLDNLRAAEIEFAIGDYLNIKEYTFRRIFEKRI